MKTPLNCEYDSELTNYSKFKKRNNFVTKRTVTFIKTQMITCSFNNYTQLKQHHNYTIDNTER